MKALRRFNLGAALCGVFLLAGCYGTWLSGIVESFGKGDGPKITTVAGTGTAGYNGDNIPATSAELSSPSGVAFDAAGNLYIADTNNNRIRMVSPGGTITTVAGDGIPGFSNTAPGEFNNPLGVAVAPGPVVYVADFNNNAVRKISSGSVSTLAGDGTENYTNGPLPGQLDEPSGVAVDSSGNLFVADFFNTVIRKISGTTISTVAGNHTGGYQGDGLAATSAELNYPYGVAVDSAGNIYIADSTNAVIRKVTVGTGTISTIAGNHNVGYAGDGGPATSASLDLPTGLAVDQAGNLYIADCDNNVIRKVDSAGAITTVAGNWHLGRGYAGDGNVATSAMLNQPFGVAVDSQGNLYIADTYNNRVRKVTFGP